MYLRYVNPVQKLVLKLARESPPDRLLSPSDTCLSPAWILDCILASWHDKMFQAHFVKFLSQTCNHSLPQGYSLPAHGKWRFGATTWVPRTLTATVMTIISQSFQRTELGKYVLLSSYGYFLWKSGLQGFYLTSFTLWPYLLSPIPKSKCCAKISQHAWSFLWYAAT